MVLLRQTRSIVSYVENNLVLDKQSRSAQKLLFTVHFTILNLFKAITWKKFIAEFHTDLLFDL